MSITRQYSCDDCEEWFEEEKSIHDEVTRKCPQCGATEPVFNQLFGDPFVMFKGAPTTFGQQAELNAKRKGKELLQIEEDNEIEKRKPVLPPGMKRLELPNTDWRKAKKPLDLRKIANVQRYIETGSKL